MLMCKFMHIDRTQSRSQRADIDPEVMRSLFKDRLVDNIIQNTQKISKFYDYDVHFHGNVLCQLTL